MRYDWKQSDYIQINTVVPDLAEILWQWLESEAAVDEAVVRGVIVALRQIGVSLPETLAALEAARELGCRELREKSTIHWRFWERRWQNEQ